MDIPDLKTNQANPDFDPLDGGWFENPLGITMEDMNQIIDETNLRDNVDDYEYFTQQGGFNVDETIGNPALFSDQNKGFSTVGVSRDQIEQYRINMNETGSVDGCGYLKIACIILGFFGLLLFMFVIVVSFLNQNTVTCPDNTQTCATCPICPSSIGLSSNTEEVSFYLRDRITVNNIFQAKDGYISSQPNVQGSMFVLSGGELRIFPGGKYAGFEGGDHGHMVVKSKKQTLKDFYIKNNQLYYGNNRIICTEDSGALFLYAIPENIEIEYKYIPAVFLGNPNQKIIYQKT